MRFLFVSNYSIDHSRLKWSGIPFYMSQSLTKAGLHLDYVHTRRNDERGNDDRTFLDRLVQIPFSLKHIFYTEMMQQNYLWSFDPLFLAYHSLGVDAKISRHNEIDLIFGPGQNGATPLTSIKTKRPIVFWDDSTVSGLLEQYPNFSNLCAETRIQANARQQRLLDQCSLAIFSSNWAAKTALDSYKFDSTRVKVVPFGANIACDRNAEDVKQIINNKSSQNCKLLFIGLEAQRKGLDLAILLVEKLQSLGLPVSLTIVGCNEKNATKKNSTPSINYLGRINKTSVQGSELIDKLFADAHFLILPSRADCSPIVLCEANSFGVPCVTSDVGGIPEIIHNGLNGQISPLSHFVESSSSFILRLFSDRPAYENLCLSSFREYENRLNWAAAGRNVAVLLEKMAK